jgi:hypothetical protein
MTRCNDSADLQHAPPHLRPSPHDGIPRRTARILGWSGFLVALIGPLVVWRRAIRAVATDFSWHLDYLVMGWTGYVLLAVGLAFMLPVVISIGRHPESRLYPRSRNAYAGWGITCYLLGCAISAQVAQIASGLGDT